MITGTEITDPIHTLPAPAGHRITDVFGKYSVGT